MLLANHILEVVNHVVLMVLEVIVILDIGSLGLQLPQRRLLGCLCHPGAKTSLPWLLSLPRGSLFILAILGGETVITQDLLDLFWTLWQPFGLVMFPFAEHVHEHAAEACITQILVLQSIHFGHLLCLHSQT